MIYRTDDPSLVYSVMNDPVLREYCWMGTGLTLEDFNFELVNNPSWYFLAVDNPCTGLFICHPVNPINWMFHANMLPGHRGDYAVKAGKAAINWMFQNSPAEKLTASGGTRFDKAIKYAQRIGFLTEGYSPKSVRIDGKLYDTVYLGLTKGAQLP